MGFIGKIKESFRKALSESSTDPAKVIPPYQYLYGEQPEIQFSQLIFYYERTPQVKLGVDTYVELVMGTDIQINVDAENEFGKKAKEILETWNKDVNFYDKLKGAVTTMFICGSSLLEKLDEKTLQDILEVDMSTIKGKQRDVYGKFQYYNQQITGTTTNKLGENNQNRFVELDLTMYSREPWGRSLFYSLAVPRVVNGEPVKPIIEDLWEMEESMASIIHNFASPNVFFTYEGASKEFLEKQATVLKKMKPGEKFIGDRKPDVTSMEVDPRGKFDSYIDHINKSIELGIQFPHDIMTGSFTSRASSQTTETIVMKKVRGYQRYIAHKIIKEIYEKILENFGYDTPDKINQVNLHVSFSTPTLLDLTPADVVEMRKLGDITRDENREWIKKETGMDLFDDEVIDQQAQDKAQTLLDAQKKQAQMPPQVQPQVPAPDQVNQQKPSPEERLILERRLRLLELMERKLIDNTSKIPQEEHEYVLANIKTKKMEILEKISRAADSLIYDKKSEKKSTEIKSQSDDNLDK